MDTTQFAESVQVFIDSILKAVTDPSDAIQIFSTLCDFPAPPELTSLDIGSKQQIFYDGCASLCRRVALGALARAASYYQPVSYDDAARIRNVVCAVIDAEIIRAGDSGEDTSYEAMKALRQAVVQDLTQRGATLSPLSQFNFAKPMPALTLAYRLYQDTKRTDQLIAFADCPHPAFMPVAFKALAR